MNREESVTRPMERTVVDEKTEPVARLCFVQAALEAVRAGVVVVNPDGRIAFANGSARELLQAGALDT